MRQSSSKVRKMVLTAILGGLSGVVMLMKFPLPFMPPFMEFEFAGVLEMIGGFALGPVAASFIILIKLIVKLVFVGSTSMLVGEFQNFLVSVAFILPAAIVYRKFKTKKSALSGMATGTILSTIVAVTTNVFFIIPFYLKLMGIKMETLIAMTKAVSPLMDDPIGLVIWGIIPFNLIKNVVISAIVYIVYKKISKQIKNFMEG